MKMLLLPTLFLNLLALLMVFVGVDSLRFIYNGFRSANLSLDGIAELAENGLLMLTNGTTMQTGHAFYPDPINFKNSSEVEAFSFSTTFVFAMRSQLSNNKNAFGFAFVIAPTKILPGGRSGEFLGLFNKSNNGSVNNHIFAVEFDTFENYNLRSIDDNHVGIDINSIPSLKEEPARYYHDNGSFDSLTLSSGDPIQAWVDYDGIKKQITVSIAPPKSAGRKPKIPLLNFTHDLSLVLNQKMYVGFSGTTLFAVNYYISGWSFSVNGVAQELDISQLPRLPRLPRLGSKKVSHRLIIGLPLICLFSILVAVIGVLYYVKRKRKFAEVLEDWEVVYGPHRFKYKDLYKATKGFKDTELLGAGGFGRVYRGLLPTSNHQIAVKRISHESRQGMREFVAEIVSIGQMSHRNLVPLLGYCRRRGELLLVYEYMPNGSLDKFLYGPKNPPLNWDQRFRIIKGVAAGLFYLHEEWEQVVVHRDVKASNVLLDGELNGRLGDFGLARLYDHGTDPQTTHVVGTVGYLAPEHYILGRATTSTDVYAFGAFLLEVVCGRRPIEPQAPREEVILVDRVCTLWNEGRVLEAIDRNLGASFNKDEAEMVLKLGLLCCNPEPTSRPSMQKVMLYLDGSMPLPEISSLVISTSAKASAYGKSFGEVSASTYSYPSPTGEGSSQYSQEAGSLLSGGR